MDVFGIGGTELLLLVFFALVILGPRRLAEVARQVGKLMGQVRALTAGLTRQLNQEIEFMEASDTRARTPSPRDKAGPGEEAGDGEAALPEAYRRFREDHPDEGQLNRRGVGSDPAGKGSQIGKTTSARPESGTASD
jgi:Tat protein translocase TatB subunit